MRPRIHPLVLSVAVLLGGCTTFGNALINALATTAGLASEWAVKQYPARRADFVTAEAALNIYLNEQTLTMDKLIDILKGAGLDETGWAGPTGDLYLKAGLVVWQLVAPANHVIAANRYVQLFGREIEQGFKRGLDQTAPGVAVAKKLTPSTVTYSPRDHLGKRIVHTGKLF